MTNVEKADALDQRLDYVQHNCSVKLSLELGPESVLLKEIDRRPLEAVSEARFPQEPYATFAAHTENIREFGAQKYRHEKGRLSAISSAGKLGTA